MFFSFVYFSTSGTGRGAPPDVPRLSPLEVSAKYLRHMVAGWNAVPGRKPEDRAEN